MIFHWGPHPPYHQIGSFLENGFAQKDDWSTSKGKAGVMGPSPYFLCERPGVTSDVHFNPPKKQPANVTTCSRNSHELTALADGRWFVKYLSVLLCKWGSSLAMVSTQYLWLQMSKIKTNSITLVNMMRTSISYNNMFLSSLLFIITFTYMEWCACSSRGENESRGRLSGYAGLALPMMLQMSAERLSLKM